MLGSFGSSSQSHDEEADDQRRRCSSTSPAIQIRQLLISCAELISRSDFSAANRLLTILSTNSSPFGDSTERLVHQFTRALSIRLNRYISSATNFLTPNASSNVVESSNDSALLQSSYLSLNQVTPFIRFSQLTANQAILEAINDNQQAIHIVDFDINHGVQWPPLMQALADRYPPPTLRITGTGNDLDTLRRTGDRLAKFAHSLGLRFQFHPLLITNNNDNDHDPSIISSIVLLPDETLAINCVFYLHRLLKDREMLRIFLHRIKSMNPKVVTLAEREANHNHPLFLQRFVEALDYYAAVFDSLEATLPPSSRERMTVEQVWFGREIIDIVAAEGDKRRERHERFRSWEVMLRSCGFSNVALSPFALSQAKLLLRLHYPSEGYQLSVSSTSNSFFLGWQNQPLFSISSWR
ncbi:scarecrow-like protein 18 [Nicotiana tomentosiformis]|uniref:Scarecrow-like protein 18 n=1 Tax=Nicotiana tabacum TaxID=4097 RepID=A0A1S4CFB9_TOBAC|nr:scarecrow-like protein 18 [Nicotiana tomentosiformis]XP_016499877.1 PREDICTED: scarecrow-like protein 18 [Nicotiana tabacum]